ncbi:MAG: Txe/YoeB family addiction module toxin [Methylacidiphilales bacterium]|nr:Txe/YoeB family addiction module toxin [Candidatus Methylacidiphilales bacterium]
MSVLFSSRGWEDYLYWQQTDKKVLKRINELVKDISRSPYEGIGKPEPLKHAFSGYWSRRITDEHRLVYKVEGEMIKIAQARYHYE